MKNRLQIRYHIPETLPTRVQAMQYLKEAFAVGAANVNDNKSLPGEPLVILYNDKANELTAAQSLATANVILAIGRGGDGMSRYNNQEYFTIDFAKHEEDINAMSETVDNLTEYVNEVNRTIEQMQKDIAKNAEDIQTIVKRIGEKGDNPEKDTVYGYVKGAYDALKEETNRAEDAELNLTHLIQDETNRAKAEESRLQTALDSETNRAKDAETNLYASVEAERDRALAAEETNRDAIENETTRAIAKENEIDAKVSNETTERSNADSILEGKINDNAKDIEFERQERKNETEKLSTKINTDIETERKARENYDTFLENKINANLNTIASNRVKSEGKTIIVTGPSDNGTNLEVNVDNKTIVTNESGTLSVSSDALVQYRGENALHVSDVVGGTKTISLAINANDKVLTNDENGLLANLSLKWSRANADGEKDEIQLIGKNNTIISRIDVADFIKDGMLDTIVFDTTDAENPKLVFTFNTNSGKEVITVNVKELIDVYVSGNGINVTNNVISLKLDESGENFLVLSENGLKLTGVQNAIETAKNELKTIVTNETNLLNNNLATVEGKVIAETNARLEADAKIREDYALADANIIKSYQDADLLLETTFKAEDMTIREAFKSADEAIRAEFKLADEQLSADYKAADQLLLENINVNNNALAILNGDATVEGSVKDVIFDSALGHIVNTVTLEDANEQSLIKKFTVDGVPYFYTSNSTSDMKHNGSALNIILDDLRSDVDNNGNATEELKNNVNTLTVTVNENVTKINALRSDVEINKNDIAVLKEDVNKVEESVDELENKINDTVNSLLAPMQATITALQNELANVKAELNLVNSELNTTRNELSTAKNELTALKENAITDIQGTDNEITVTKTGNTATVRFADDAYFVAGV